MYRIYTIYYKINVPRKKKLEKFFHLMLYVQKRTKKLVMNIIKNNSERKKRVCDETEYTQIKFTIEQNI